jgi:hypothetical protein
VVVVVGVGEVVVVAVVDGVVDVVGVVVTVAVVVSSEVVVSTPPVSERETRAPARTPARRRITAPTTAGTMSLRLGSPSRAPTVGPGSPSPCAGWRALRSSVSSSAGERPAPVSTNQSSSGTKGRVGSRPELMATKVLRASEGRSDRELPANEMPPA